MNSRPFLKALYRLATGASQGLVSLLTAGVFAGAAVQWRDYVQGVSRASKQEVAGWGCFPSVALQLI